MIEQDSSDTGNLNQQEKMALLQQKLHEISVDPTGNLQLVARIREVLGLASGHAFAKNDTQLDAALRALATAQTDCTDVERPSSSTMAA